MVPPIWEPRVLVAEDIGTVAGHYCSGERWMPGWRSSGAGRWAWREFAWEDCASCRDDELREWSVVGGRLPEDQPASDLTLTHPEPFFGAPDRIAPRWWAGLSTERRREVVRLRELRKRGLVA